MAGIFLVLLGVFRLGSVIKFIPYPIVVGFTSGIALTIFTTQVKDFLGLHIAGAVPRGLVDKWVCYFRHIATVDWAVLAVAVSTVLLIVGTQKVAKRVPGSLVAIVVTTVVVALTNAQGLTHIPTIGDRFGASPPRFPPVTAWDLDWHGLFTAPDAVSPSRPSAPCCPLPWSLRCSAPLRVCFPPRGRRRDG